MNVVELSVGGNSKQETRSGSNILNFNVSQNSKVIVNNDGTITINGTGGFTLNFEQITLKSDVTYYQKLELISGNVTGININNSFMSFNGSTWLVDGKFISITPQSDTEKSGLWINNSAVFENAVIKLWANTDQSDFEPYGAMPSPLYPSNVETVGSDVSTFDLAEYLNTQEFEINQYGYFGFAKLPDNFKSTIRMNATEITKTKFLSFGLIDVKSDTISENLRVLQADGTITERVYDFSNSESVYFFIADTSKFKQEDLDTILANYNIEISSCTEIVVSNGNELNFEEKSTTWNGSTITVVGNKVKITGNENGGSGLSYSSNRQKVDLRKGTTMTYSSKYVSGVLTSGNTYYHLYGVNKDGISTKLIDLRRDKEGEYKNDRQATYILQEDIKEIYISGSTYNVSGLTEELVYKFQLEIGDTATEIIEHTERTKTVDIQQEMLEGDYFVKEEDGWKEVHLWGKYTLNGTQTLIIGALGDTYTRFYSSNTTDFGEIIGVNSEINCISENLKAEKWLNGLNLMNKECISTYKSRVDICLENTRLTELTENGLKNYLKDNNIKFYAKQTPLKLACTEKQSAQLDDLLKTSTYKNVTHIYSTDKVGPIIKVVYRKDTPTLLNNICKLIIENGGI